MIESFIFIASLLPASAENDDFDLGVSFREDSVDIELELKHPGSAEESWDENTSGGGAPGDSSSESGNGSGGGSGDGTDAEGGGTSTNRELSVFYCLGAGGYVDPDCQGFEGSFPQVGRALGCVIGRTLSDDEEYAGLAPREICEDDEPDPALEVEEAVLEDPPADAETDWEQILSQIPGEVEQAFAELPIDGGEVSFEPDLLGFGYINRHTNVFVDTGPQLFTETLLGIEVEIRASPVDYRFDYGDGTVRTVHDPGGPAAGISTGDGTATLADTETPTSHVYQETGVYPVEVTTTFIGEYRLAGGSWIPIIGTAEVPASPGQADIWRIDHRHVAEECQETAHWGCSGPVELGPDDEPPAVFADQYDESGRYLGP